MPTRLPDLALLIACILLLTPNVSHATIEYIEGAELPAVSPDGRRIAFCSDVLSNDQNTDILCIDVKGGRLVDLTNQVGDEYNPAWSPDGARIAFSQSCTGGFAVVTMNADGTAKRRLATVDQPYCSGIAWTPDGRSLVCGAGTALLVVSQDGKQNRLLSTAGEDAGRLRCTPDGRWAYYTTEGFDKTGLRLQTEVWKLALKSRRAIPIRVTREPFPGYDLSVSFDAKSVVFSRDGQGVQGIWTARLDGSLQRRIMPDGHEPAWCFDGSSLAAVRWVEKPPLDWRSGDSWYAADLWVVGEDGTNLRRVSDLFPIYAKRNYGALRWTIQSNPGLAAVIVLAVVGAGLYITTRRLAARRASRNV